MRVSSKAYKVWKILFDHPNEWLTLSYISHEADMSNRQTSSVLQTMGYDHIQRAEVPPNRSVEIMLTVSDDELADLKREVMRSFHGIDDEVMENIRSALSTVGWTSAQDIAVITGYGGFKIYVAISMMDDVISKESGSARVYMLARAWRMRTRAWRVS